jgi:hypothetical protein
MTAAIHSQELIDIPCMRCMQPSIIIGHAVWQPLLSRTAKLNKIKHPAKFTSEVVDSHTYECGSLLQWI